MAAMDEFREEREALKNADFKTKWNYFLDYYKWHVIAGIIVIIVVVSFIHSVTTAKDTAFSGYFINTFDTTETNDTSLAESFAEVAGIDLNQNEIYIDTSLSYAPGQANEMNSMTLQKVTVTIAAQDTDFLAINEQAFDDFAHNEYFFDLRELYSEDELEKYADYIYYIDMQKVRDRQAVLDTGSTDIPDMEYDHFKPEEMTEPIPVALCIEDSQNLGDTYSITSSRIPMGIVASSQRVDTALQFVDYLFEGVVE